MVVGYFNVIGISINELEHNSKLIIYPNAMLACMLSFQRLKTVAGRHPKIIQTCCSIQEIQLPDADIAYSLRKFFAPACDIELLSLFF